MNNENNADFDFRESPCVEYPFFCYDPMDFKFYFFRTELERDQYVELEMKPFYRHETGFHDEVMFTLGGVVTHTMREGSHRDCTFCHIGQNGLSS